MDREQPAALKAKPHVMIVDDNVVNLQVARKALSDVYTIIPVTSGKTALTLLAKSLPSLILLDIDMPEMDGFETIKHIKNNAATKDIPVIFLTAMDNNVSELEGLRLGAVDYVTKPFSIPLLIQRVDLHIALIEQKVALQNYNDNLSQMVKEKTEVIEELQHAVIYALSDLIECRDGLTGGHVTRTQKYLKALAEGLVLSGEYAAELQNADIDLWVESAQLHDIGKVGIPDYILKKPEKLTAEEFAIIKTHPVIGEKALKNAMEMTRAKDFLRYAAIVAISHHERWDGTGYPYGLKGTEIPLIGRLMAIADVYDALVSERPYKKAFSHEKAVRIITENSGRHFDPVLTRIFTVHSYRFVNIVINKTPNVV
jgi:Response regulator containing a CheY-like receiver domain and an HD-GYP domain